MEGGLVVRSLEGGLWCPSGRMVLDKGLDVIWSMNSGICHIGDPLEETMNLPGLHAVCILTMSANVATLYLLRYVLGLLSCIIACVHCSRIMHYRAHTVFLQMHSSRVISSANMQFST